MFTNKQKIKAVKLYIKYACKTSSVLRELEYLKDRKTLIKWHREYINTDCFNSSYTRKPKYSKEDKSISLKHYLEHRKCISGTVNALGYPRRHVLLDWIKKDYPNLKTNSRKNTLLKIISP